MLDAIYGAIFGDITGCLFEGMTPFEEELVFRTDEHGNLLPHDNAHITDDTVCTIAITDALQNSNLQDDCDIQTHTIHSLRKFCRGIPWVGYGKSFRQWFESDTATAYGSYGNGCVMRISPVAYFAQSKRDVKRLAKDVTVVTHNHPESIKAVECCATLIFLCLQGKNKKQLQRVAKHYYRIDFDFYEMRANRKQNLDVTAQGCMPIALRAFFDSTSFIDCIRKLVAWGGDADTLAAIGGGIAGAFYGIDEYIIQYIQQQLETDCQNSLKLLPTIQKLQP